MTKNLLSSFKQFSALNLLTLFFLALSIQKLSSQIVEQVIPIRASVLGKIALGHSFITPVPLDTISKYSPSLAVLDNAGKIVWYKAYPEFRKVFPSPIIDFKLQPTGLISFSTLLHSGEAGMYLLNEHFEIVDSITCIGNVETDGHDFIHSKDGTYLLVGLEERIMNVSHLRTYNGASGDSTAVVLGNVIQKFDKAKNLVYEWKSLDYFKIEDTYSHFFINPKRLDHSHFNSIEIDQDGHYLISFRHLHEITKVNSKTGDIIWRMGGKNNEFSFIGDTLQFSGQHDARRLPNGNLSLFDNGQYNSTSLARAIEFKLDEQKKTATRVWSFNEPNRRPSMFTGNAQRFDNGNTLIDWGGAYPLDKTFTATEVDSLGNIVMTLDLIPNDYMSYRVLKYELPFELTQVEIECDNENKRLSAPEGYAYYEWNTGETSSSIDIKDTGDYQVWVNHGIGYLSSKEFKVRSLQNLCGSIHSNSVQMVPTKLFPNPVQNVLNVRLAQGQSTNQYQVLGLDGQEIIKGELDYSNQFAISTNNLAPGFYLLKIGSSMSKFIKE